MATSFAVFDPAMCCSTGVCGPNVDSKLVHFAADLDWLKSQGVDVQRYNLAHQPMEFARQTVISDLLTKTGTQALPAIVVNGVLVSQGRYPDRGELAAMAGLKAEFNVSAHPGTEEKAPLASACCGAASTAVNIGLKAKSKRSCCGG
ncbi:MAG: arsenite efflux transporter metallochaperone ArsD [Phycisphaerae bacterium]